MAEIKQSNKVAGISAEAVAAKTDKTWAQWFAVLDEVKATAMAHKEIAAYLQEAHQLSGWWSQMITVGYEQERGLRQKHETPQGFQISRSKTIGVPLDTLYQAWHDEGRRQRWLPDDRLITRKATPNKSMRLTWSDGETNLEVNFYARGQGKSQVVVQHTKLPDEKAAATMKDFWAEKLVVLKEILEA